MQKVGEKPMLNMIITVYVRNSSGFEAQPLEFNISDKGVLETLVRNAREMGLYNPSPVSTEDGAVLGFGWHGHHKEVAKGDGHTIVHYDFVTIIYGHEKGREVHNFADFTTLVGELLKL